MSYKVFAFDFDGTLTRADSFPLFVRFACGRRAWWGGVLRHAPLLALMVLRLYASGRVKERLFGHFFAGMALEQFDALCRRFAASQPQLLRPEALRCLLDALATDGARVVVVSASPQDWVRPFFGPEVRVEGTRLESRDGRLTGRFASANCRGREKVERLKGLFPRRDEYTLVAYGDSRGDREMLEYADERHYKPFR